MSMRNGFFAGLAIVMLFIAPWPVVALVVLWFVVEGADRWAFDKRCQQCGMPYAIYRRAKTMDLCRKHMKIHDAKHRSPRNPMKYEGRDAPLGGFNGEFD